MRSQGLWFGPADRPAMGWLSLTDGGYRRSGVLIAPPFGYPYWGSHRTLRVLAERLALAGHLPLRIDYDGTGDSAGDQWDPDRVAAWRRTLADGAAELRRLGATTVTVVGVRIGATLALLDGADLGAEAVVAWMPFHSAGRYVKELRLLSEPIPADADPLSAGGTRTFAGNVFAAETLRDLKRLSLADLAAPPAARVLVVDDAAGSSADTVARLRELGSETSHVQLDGGDRALEVAPEYATVPEEIVSAMSDWIGTADDLDGGPAGGPRTEATFAWRGGTVRERVMTLAPHGHVAIVTSPVQPDCTGATLVMLNPGSETHVGPGRAWVEYARDLALQGRSSVRVDFVGWGESPDEGHAPGRPYDQHTVGDAVAIAQELKAAGHDRLVLFGLCASAWIALRAILEGPVSGVIAINPQLYWQPGDLVEINWDLIRADRAAEIARIERGCRLGIWNALDALGHRSRAARWLDELAATGAPVRLVFTESDDGLKYINERLQRRVARLRASGRVAVRELVGVDHPMHRTWLRPRVVSAIAEELDAIDAACALRSDAAGPVGG